MKHFLPIFLLPFNCPKLWNWFKCPLLIIFEKIGKLSIFHFMNSKVTWVTEKSQLSYNFDMHISNMYFSAAFCTTVSLCAFVLFMIESFSNRFSITFASRSKGQYSTNLCDILWWVAWRQGIFIKFISINDMGKIP